MIYIYVGEEKRKCERGMDKVAEAVFTYYNGI